MQLREQLDKGVLEPFIHHIRFPQYRNLEENLKIDFSYPITAITGVNGTNKSSILRALYGSPKNKSIGTYWFATSLDPIPQGKNNQTCFIYGYKNEKRESIKEVLKTRSGLKDPDYFETSRPLKKYGMDTLEKKRNKPVDKDVIYLDFRHNLSAFDKFFYAALSDDVRDLNKRKYIIRKRSKALRRSIYNNQGNSTWYKKERILDDVNFFLSDKIVDIISNIIGRKYKSIKIIKHSFFPESGYTVFLNFGESEYSEAFAGSGEFAVVMTVWQIDCAQCKSLILLDEPEVSLHPGAQKRLLDFVKNQVKKKHHQFVLATHSPEFIKNLPNDAIKSFVMDPEKGTVSLPSQNVTPEEAFSPLGYISGNKKLFLVEDVMSKLLIEFSLIKKNKINIWNSILVKIGGGCNDIYSKIPYEVSKENKNMFIILDGDMKKIWPVNNDTSNSAIRKFLGNILGEKHVNHLLSERGRTDAEKTKKLRDIVAWGADHVAYLPGDAPEDLVLATALEKGGEDTKKLIHFYLEGKNLQTENVSLKGKGKDFLDYFVKKKFFTNHSSGEDRERCARMILSEIPSDWCVWEEILKIIEGFLRGD